MGLYPYGKVWFVGDSKTDGVTDAPGSCGPRDPAYVNFLAKVGGSLVGTTTGGADGLGGVLTPCPISGVALAGDGHPGYFCQDITTFASSWYGTAGPANVGVLYIGTNDLIQISQATPGFTIDRLYSDFATCLATVVALDANVRWFVCNMDPMPGFLVPLPFFFQFNAFVAAQVKQYQRQGKQVYLIDLFSAPITYNSGGIHQDVAGYAATATRMVAAMQTLRPAG